MSQKQVLTDEQRERRNAYARRYRAAHPEKVRQWRENYACSLADRVKARSVKGGRDE